MSSSKFQFSPSENAAGLLGLVFIDIYREGFRVQIEFCAANLLEVECFRVQSFMLQIPEGLRVQNFEWTCVPRAVLFTFTVSFHIPVQ